MLRGLSISFSACTNRQENLDFSSCDKQLGGFNGRFITQLPFYYAGIAIYITLSLVLDSMNSYLPKGRNLSGYSQPQLNAIARQLNERPRITLGFHKPAEMFSECVALTG